MASECRHRLLPIPCCTRQHRSTATLPQTRQSTVAKRTGTSQSTRAEELGEAHSSLRQVDTNTPRSAPLPGCPLLRHSSFIRAVCVDAHRSEEHTSELQSPM